MVTPQREKRGVKMRLRNYFGIIATATLSMSPLTSPAEDDFHVHYRLENLSEDSQYLSGTLFLNVYNTSGEDAFEIIAWVLDPNQVTYDQRQIGVGSLADGAQVEVLDEFIVPIEITQGEQETGPVTWRLEYTDPLGARHAVDVLGNDVP